MSDEQDTGTQPVDTTTQTTTTAPSGADVVSGATDAAATETAAGEAGKTAGTVLGNDAQDKAVAVPADWPDDWRGKLAGEDKKFLNTLERFASPSDLAKAYRELQVKVSSGQLKNAATKPADGATPEELATWRKENGIPEKPEDYKVELPNGVVLGEADKPAVTAFLEHAHARNLPPEAVNTALGFYYEWMDQQKAALQDNDDKARAQTEDVLRKEWGDEYRRNINAANNLLAMAPPGLSDALLNGRLADGTIAGNSPHLVAWLANLAREMNPMASLVPAGTTDAMKSGSQRIEEIKTTMANNPDAYWKNPAMQEEFVRLIDAQQKMQARSAA